MYQHILVPTDGSALSVPTIADAVRFAQAVSAHITFLYVESAEGSDLYGDAALLRSIAPEEFSEKTKHRTREILATAEAAGSAAGVPCSSVTRSGRSPHEAIVDTADELHCDLIFMASHGRSSKVGMMIGSETLKTLIDTKVPVLVSCVATNMHPAAA